MKIFVSSSFEDLKEQRAAAIRVLRQLGHEVVAMEDMVSGTAVPLLKVMRMVEQSEAYVGIFAWRYGFEPVMPNPGQGDVPNPLPPSMGPDKLSITHREYLRAVERELPIMAFLLDEHYPWPPHLIDGFDLAKPGGQPDAAKIRDLRLTLQTERVISFFTTPSDLEARVSAAVTVAGLTRQLDLLPAAAMPPNTGAAGDSYVLSGITQAIVDAGDQHRALKIDLLTDWWSTRLYLIAKLAERLTQARRILVVDSDARKATGASGPAVISENFIGQISTSGIISTLEPRAAALKRFAAWLQARPLNYDDIGQEISGILLGWQVAFKDSEGNSDNERKAKTNLTAVVLRRWFGDAMLTEPLRIGDLQRASVVDLLRLLDYPNAFVPVLTQGNLPGQAMKERVDVIDKVALNARLSRSYLVELMDRARLN